MKKIYLLLTFSAFFAFSNSALGQTEKIPLPKTSGGENPSYGFKKGPDGKFDFGSIDKNLRNKRPDANKDHGTSHASDYDYVAFLNGGSNVPYAAITDANGNTFITGITSNADSPQGDFTTVMLDASGTLVWEKKMQGQKFTLEMGRLITLDSSGNPVVAGVTWNGSDMDITVVKYNAQSGAVVWESTFDSGKEGFEYPTAMTLSKSDEIYIAGMVPREASLEYLTLKMDADGRVIWSAIDKNPIEGTQSEPTAIAVDERGHVAVTGIAAVEGDASGYYEGCLTIAYDANGAMLWRMPYRFERLIDETDAESGTTTTHSAANDIAFDAAGNAYIVGTFDNTSSQRLGLIKYAVTGEELWVETYRAELDGERMTTGTHIAITDADQILVAGLQMGDFSTEGLVAASYTLDGAMEWSKLTSDTSQPQGLQMSLDQDGLPIISYYGYDPSNSDQYVRVRKYSLEGEVVNEGNYLLAFSPTFNISGLINVSTDADNSIYIVLNNFYSERGNVFETVKKTFDAAIDPLWTYVYETPDSKSNTRLLATSFSGNDLYATGDHAYIKDGEFLQVYFVTKYNQDGTEAWRKEFDPSEGNGADGIVALNNSKGELLVILMAYPYSVNTFKIIKFSPEGEKIWEMEPSYINPSFDSFVFDENDNLYLAGTSQQSEDDYVGRFFVSKISDGGEAQWSTFIDTGNAGDTSFQLNAGASMPSGNLVYTGSSGVGSFFSKDIDLTVFSISAEGALNWLKKFPQDNFNTIGKDLVVTQDNAVFIAGVRQDQDTGAEEINLLKLNAEGEEDWSVNYGQTKEGRSMNPYSIALTTDGDALITSYSLYSVPDQPTNNRVSAVQFNGENGDLGWVYNSPIDRYFADSYVDGNDVTYLYCQRSFATKKSFSIQGLTGGALIKVGPDGLQQGVEMAVFPEQEATFFPKTLVPLDNEKLILSGYISHDLGFFSGLYFFEDAYQRLGITDFGGTAIGKSLISSIYPNPAKQQINIALQMNQEDRVAYKIIDLQGRIIMESKGELQAAGSSSIKINLPQLPAGMYLCQINCGAKSTSKKFIVQ